MRLFKTMFVAAIAVFMATSASALVSITYSTDQVLPLNIGESFDVDITVGYDGNPAQVTAIAASMQWDPAQLQLVGAVGPAQPFAIFFGGGGFLGKLADAGTSFAGDPAGTTRTVQYGASPGQSGGAGPDTLIQTLRFQVIGAGDGTAELDVISLDDGVFFNLQPAEPGQVSLVGTSVSIVPEPGTALLMSLGLAGLASAGRRNR